MASLKGECETVNTGSQNRETAPRWLTITLWITAGVLMFAAARYQERTGPTYELRGSFQLGGASYSYELIRSGDSREDAPVQIPRAGSDVSATLNFRRYPTDDEFTSVEFLTDNDEMVAFLPRQPAAGKLEYYVEINSPSGAVRIPESSDENIIIRFKDPVPISVLVPHIIMMFFALLIGMRTALSAVFCPENMRKLAWVTLVLMTLGGLILGPVVQKYAFGALWTGIPFGWDLTDNKTLIMWLAWVGVCGLFLWKRMQNTRTERIAVILAAVIMVVVYLIPHSLRGSQLDYEALDDGVPASEAVGTGQPG